MALIAALIPASFANGHRFLGWLQKSRMLRHPFVFLDQINQWGESHLSTAAGVIPVLLHMMAARCHHQFVTKRRGTACAFIIEKILITNTFGTKLPTVVFDHMWPSKRPATVAGVTSVYGDKRLQRVIAIVTFCCGRDLSTQDATSSPPLRSQFCAERFQIKSVTLPIQEVHFFARFSVLTHGSPRCRREVAEQWLFGNS